MDSIQSAYMELGRFLQRADRERDQVINLDKTQPSAAILLLKDYYRDIRQIPRVIPMQDRLVTTHCCDKCQPLEIEVTWSDLDNEGNIQTFNLFYECACVLFNLSTALAKQAVDYLQVGILFSVNCSMLPRTLSTMLAIAMPKRQILSL